MIGHRALLLMNAILCIAFPFETVLWGQAVNVIARANVGDLGNQPMPVWNGSALVTIQSSLTASPRITVYDQQGRAIRTVAFTIPAAATINVFSFAHGVDGRVAICGEAIDSDGRSAHIIATVDMSGQENVVKTDPYFPTKVTISADGSLWTAGYEYLPNSHNLNPAANVIRRWAATGALMAGYVRQADFENVRLNVAPDNYLTTGGDRIALYGARDDRFIEVSLSAGGVRDFVGVKVPGASHKVVTGLALTSDGATFISCFYPTDRHYELFRLDEQANTWIVVADRLPHGWIYGSEGNLIVGLDDLAGSFKLFQVTK